MKHKRSRRRKKPRGKKNKDLINKKTFIHVINPISMDPILVEALKTAKELMMKSQGIPLKML